MPAQYDLAVGALAAVQDFGDFVADGHAVILTSGRAVGGGITGARWPLRVRVAVGLGGAGAGAWGLVAQFPAPLRVGCGCVGAGRAVPRAPGWVCSPAVMGGVPFRGG
ncbi:hypothetical protein GCM10018772_50760 [Streptomyces fumanus]|uniref:Uncharacterized protein n=1 Tax=Streptomyces fumanus TaxID=67302 RepID=A0A919AQ51_9ACTN|nr:hypothetical protein GCM10018772_50760 [Streptomyces fumanus]